jgi:hypothetical protein
MPLFATVSPAAGVRKIHGNGLGSLFSVVLLAASPAYAATTTTTLTITSNGGAVTTVAPRTVVTLTAAVNTGAAVLTTGQVNFCDATATYCTDIHIVGTAQLTSAGTAMMKFVPGIGSHSYKAVFVGTNSNTTSSSAGSSLVVTGAGTYPSTATITSSGSAGNYTLSATVVGMGTTTSPSPTGTVSFVDTSAGGSTLTTAPLGAGTSGLGFTNSFNLANGVTPGSMAVGDFNGDGKKDLALVDLSGNAIVVLLGNGDGTFTSAASVAGGNPILISTGDFNGDGRMDLAVVYQDVADTAGTVMVLLGNGNGTFTATASPATTGNNPASIVVGDFNGDGNADLAVANEGSNTITLLLGNGDGTFTAATSLGITAPNSLTVGDFNGDGKSDLAVLEVIASTDPLLPSSNAVAVLLGNGDGTFTTASSTSLCCTASSIVAGDFNGDGKADLAVPFTSYRGDFATGASVSVLLGNGDGTFAQAPAAVLSGISAASTTFSSSIADFNGDGKPDLEIVANSPTVSVLLGNGDGTFMAVSSPLAHVTGYSFAADFNGDGYTDIALSNYSSSSGSEVLVELVQPTQTATAGVNNFALIGTGVHQVEASYPGDGTYGPSVSSPIGLTGVSGTTLTLSANPTTSTYGQQVVLTATLSPYNASGHSTDGETISFFYDAAGDNLGPATLASGVAVLNATSIPAGTNSLRAVYSGDGALAPSSSTLSYTVTTLPSISFSVQNHVYGNAPFSVAATSNSTGALTYSVVSGPATMSGSTVTMTGAGTVVLQVTQAAAGGYSASAQTASLIVNPAPLAISANSVARVFGASNPVFTGTVTGAVNGDTFTETFSTSATAASIAGSYPIVPSVTGAQIGNYIVTTANGALTITQAGTATTFALSNQNTTLTANVASLTSGVPTGSVGFYEGQTLVGTGTLSNGVATYTTSSTPSGNVVVTAQYSGDANFTQSGSPPIFLLSVAPANSSLTVASAGSVVDTVSLSSAPGYIGTVQFSCANLPLAATCSFQPSSFSFTGATNTGSVSLTIQTGVTTQAGMWPVRPVTEEVRSGILATLIWVPGLFATIFTRGRRRPGPRTRKSLLIVLLLFSMAATLTSCSGGSSSSGSSSSSGKTPAGAYTVQLIVSGSNGLSQTANLNLNIQ